MPIVPIGRVADREKKHLSTTVLLGRLLGQRIRAARLKGDMTEASLAERAGTTRVTLRKIEQGHLGVAIGTVLDLCVILGVPILEASEAKTLRAQLAHADLELRALPRRIRDERKPEVNDDF